MDDSQHPPGKTRFYNLSVNVLNKHELLESIDNELSAGRPITTNFLNAHCFNVAQEDSAYRKALDECSFLLNDGIGVDIAAKLIGMQFKENLNGTDLIPEIMSHLAKKGMSIFCYGAREDVIQQAVKNIETALPDVRIAGFSDGYVDPASDIVRKINKSGAEVVILGLGVPMQELWVHQYAAEVRCARVFICGGAIFDFLSGSARRAPVWMRNLRLEWLFRLIREPGRLFSRYVLGSFRFLWHLLRTRN